MDRICCTDEERRCSNPAARATCSRRADAGYRTQPAVRKAWWKTLTFIQQFDKPESNVELSQQLSCP
ncbi:hypothetical protein AVEN_260167-1 [Araneus ventricosus]|uniref:Uncharacterized protein n=1 Tax=Araneus ventricosus TaxID=182803 RepID=A0A4Y2DQE5_ARAVE|nr:hypothetical protein AVEN_260167-1 [Araneus ventricosus]